MKIIYVSSTCSREKYAQYVESRGARVSQQAQKYNLLLAEGLSENGADVTVVSSRPINRNVEKRRWIPAEKEDANGLGFTYLPFINYPLLRQLWVFMGTLWEILRMKVTREDSAIICDALNISAATAVLAAAFLRGIRTVGIVTDIPGILSCSQKTTWVQKLHLTVMRGFDNYLLLTEPMSQIVNSKNRPYIVLEGHTDQAMTATENTLAGKSRKKICLYAGSLMEIYGIGALVEGFLSAAIPDTELHIYGDGDYTPKLKQLASQNESIKYMGVVPNSEIVKAELAATLLINPRPTNELYTRYSFPSKNMEYMASGTPVLTTRLPGMPEDHKPYVFFIEQENADGIRDALQRILAMDAQALHEFGAAAKDFVIKEKSNCVQAAKVIAFIKAQRVV